MDSAESVGLCKSNFALNNILHINQLRNSSNDKIEPMETVLILNKEWRNNAEDMWKVKDTLNQSNKNKFFATAASYVWYAKRRHYFVGYISTQNNNPKAKLKIWSQYSGTPDLWSWGNVGPRGSRIVKATPRTEKETSFCIKINKQFCGNAVCNMQ